jgi:hypothetical protein
MILLKELVGAWRFEHQISWAQGKRVIFSKSFLYIVAFESKRLGENIC